MALATGAEERLAEARRLGQTEPQKAQRLYQSMLMQHPGASDAAIRDYEHALMGLGELYRDQRKVDALVELVRQTRSVLSSFAKAKTAKLGAWAGGARARAVQGPRPVADGVRAQCASCWTSSAPSPTAPTCRWP